MPTTKKKPSLPRRPTRRACDLAADEAKPLGLEDAGALAIAGAEELVGRAADTVVDRGRRLAHTIATTKRKA
ncbi:MAG TPA: hypothetical protein VIA18_00595 [Polyangia bacterium]|jgi:hypothetical protein|nr:hypothetical protein [Polyangia bacterium]